MITRACSCHLGIVVAVIERSQKSRINSLAQQRPSTDQSGVANAINDDDGQVRIPNRSPFDNYQQWPVCHNVSHVTRFPALLVGFQLSKRMSLKERRWKLFAVFDERVDWWQKRSERSIQIGSRITCLVTIQRSYLFVTFH